MTRINFLCIGSYDKWPALNYDKIFQIYFFLCEVPSKNDFLKVVKSTVVLESKVHTFNPADLHRYLYANSVDPVEKAHNEPSHQDLYSLKYIEIHFRNSYIQQWICPNSEMDETTSGT